MAFSFNGKNILITQPIISRIGGSTVVTIELAEFLISVGANVTIYTCSYADPAKKFFEESHITVFSADDSPNLRINEFDYIWVNSQILPKSFLDDFKKGNRARIIYCHMSGIDWIPDEKPWIYGLEENTCSLKLYVSENTKELHDGYIKKDIPFKYFRNPCPDKYGDLKSKKNRLTPKNVLIVSNHPPLEVLKAKTELENNGVNVILLSDLNEEPDLINPNYIDKADVVITIGKTVQYCLVSGTPVYIYDHFGGQGYLNEKNYDSAAASNFSGRHSRRKNSHTIVSEIINGYEKSLMFHSSHRRSFKKKYLARNVIPDIFKAARLIKISPFEEDHLKAIALCQDLAINYFKTLTRELLLETKIKSLNVRVADYEALKKSKTWKIGKIVVLPMSLVRKVLNRIGAKEND